MAATVSERLEAGDLDGAIEILNNEVRQKPTDTARRGALVELLCIAGNLERADRLLDALQQQDTSVALGVALFRQLIRAEQARQQFYGECRLPEFLDPPSAEDQLYLKAVVALHDGDKGGAAGFLAEAEAKRAPLSGKVDDVSFDDIRDLDDFAATHFEVLTSTGKFYWIPMRRVESVIFHRPERRRDLLWRRATMSVASGPDGEVFLPATYPWDAPARTALRLGRETDFTGGDGEPVRGLGLRSFLFGDAVRTILEIGRIDFDLTQ